MNIDTDHNNSQKQLVNDEMNEIISYKPHWIIRNGNIIFITILSANILFSMVISYPDVVGGSAKLMAVNGPKTATAYTSGKLTAILVKPKQQVRSGQYLAYIESIGSHSEMLNMYNWLKQTIDQLKTSDVEDVITSHAPYFDNLGELQSNFQSFTRDWNETQQFFRGGYYEKKKLSLIRDLQFNSRLKDNIHQQLLLNKQERELQQIEYTAYDSLSKFKVIAPLELNQHRNDLLGKDQVITQTSAQLINNEVAAHDKEKEILDLKKKVLDQEQTLINSLLSLKSETEAWINKYIVIAPESGTLYYASPLQTSEHLESGQELFYIQPSNSYYYVQAMAGQNNLGKIKEGQRVRLSVASYPSAEYGYLQGTVTTISNFPNRRDSFFVEVKLDNGLKTTYGNEVFFRNNLTATAEIITDNRKLFDRFFEPLKKILRWN